MNKIKIKRKIGAYIVIMLFGAVVFSSSVSAINAGTLDKQQRSNSIISYQSISITNIRFGFPVAGIRADIVNSGTTPETVNWWINFTGGGWFNHRIYGPIEWTIDPGHTSTIKACPMGVALKNFNPMTVTIDVVETGGTVVSYSMSGLGYAAVFIY